jgi:hypothetical protein
MVVDIPADKTSLVVFLTPLVLSCHVAIPLLLGSIFFSSKVVRHPGDDLSRILLNQFAHVKHLK